MVIMVILSLKTASCPICIVYLIDPIPELKTQTEVDILQQTIEGDIGARLGWTGCKGF